MSTAKGGGADRNAAGGAPRRSRAAGGNDSGGRPAPPPAAAPAPAPLTPGRFGLYAVLLVAGVLVALAGTLVQAAWFPGGLLLALAGAAGLFYGGGLATGTTPGALVPVAAWLVTIFVLLGQARPEGDFLFGAGTSSYLFLGGGVAAAVICATVAQRRALSALRGRVGG